MRPSSSKYPKTLLSEAALDLKKALEVAQGMEAAEQTTKHMHGLPWSS